MSNDTPKKRGAIYSAKVGPAQRAALTPTLVVMAPWLKNYCRHESRKGDEFCHIWGWMNGSVRDSGSAGPAGERQPEDSAGNH